MGSPLKTEQALVVNTAKELTRERLGPRASLYDSQAAHPTENWSDLWEAGLLAIGVPKRYGGTELDPLTYVMVLEEIAKGCTNTSMTLHMHSTVQRFIAPLATPEQKDRLYPEVVDRGKLFGSWGSEPAASLSRNFFVETSIEEADGGYVINGAKHFCTMAEAASYYMTWCVLNGSEDMSAGLMLALVPAGSQGLKIVGEWNTLGMRGTVSPSVEFKGCLVTKEQILGPPGEASRVGILEGFPLGYAAIYLGAATTALEFVTDYCKAKTFRPDPRPIAEDPTIQRHIAEMSIHLEAARGILYASASKWEDADAANRGLLAAKAKYLYTEAALAATSQALQVVGGRSAHKSMPLERLFRDVRTSTLMPPNPDAMLVNIGKAQLGY